MFIEHVMYVLYIRGVSNLAQILWSFESRRWGLHTQIYIIQTHSYNWCLDQYNLIEIIIAMFDWNDQMMTRLAVSKTNQKGTQYHYPRLNQGILTIV